MQDCVPPGNKEEEKISSDRENKMKLGWEKGILNCVCFLTSADVTWVAFHLAHFFIALGESSWPDQTHWIGTQPNPIQPNQLQHQNWTSLCCSRPRSFFSDLPHAEELMESKIITKHITEYLTLGQYLPLENEISYLQNKGDNIYFIEMLWILTK